MEQRPPGEKMPEQKPETPPVSEGQSPILRAFDDQGGKRTGNRHRGFLLHVLVKMLSHHLTSRIKMASNMKP